MKVFVSPLLPDFRKSIGFEGSQASRICLGKMKMSMEQWWDNADRRILKYSGRENLSHSNSVHHKPRMEWTWIKISLNPIYIFSSYRAGNTSRRNYKKKNTSIAAFSVIHKNLYNTLCGHNIDCLNVKHYGVWSTDWTLKGYLLLNRLNGKYVGR